MTPSPPEGSEVGAERRRMAEARARERNWMRWGPYLAERQWGTVREDYSADGDAWRSFTHDDACRRAYRWGEDGLLGFTDRECRMCFALALWNGKDSLLKERLFGLTNPEGNHGEDVKELYYYLDATPTSSYLRAGYLYPQNEFPYARLVEENGRRTLTDPEYELEDTGIFAENRYFDVCVEYAKADVEDVLVRVRVVNRGPDPAPIHVLPTVWFRNTWAWGRTGEDYWPRGRIARDGEATLSIDHPSLGRYRLDADRLDSQRPRWLFTENESDTQCLFGTPNASPFVKDAFHRRVVGGEDGAVNPAEEGTKAAAWYVATVPPGGDVTIRLRWTAVDETSPPAGERFGDSFTHTFERRRREADEFHASARSAPLDDDERRIVRQADAGLLWSRQFYHYAVETWLDGDPAQPPPPESRRHGRNHPWRHVHARDVLSVPDKWEYPWFAAWDLAFHCVALARIDPEHAKDQLLRLCREWYMNPSGQLPAYEYDFGAVNPPVHAWAAWRVYQLTGERGDPPDRAFLESAFHKCIINFTWWVNREDVEGDNLFTGGFLGLDNIGLFDRSRPIAGGGKLEQADATAWMAFYSSTMLAIALELARENDAYEGIASKFFEHFVRIAQAMNELGGAGLWDEADGFYYDHLRVQGASTPLRVRSMVGLIPLFAAESLESEHLDRLPLFRRRLEWFLANVPEVATGIACLHPSESREHRLLSIPTRERLVRVLARVLDEREFLSPYGVRSLSKAYETPYSLELGGDRHEIHYASGNSDSRLFGGNSNWRGPVWFPLNYLLIEALKRHHHFYGDSLRVECPTRSGRQRTLLEVAEELERRLASLFEPDASGRRPCHRGSRFHSETERDRLLFHEYFDGDDGRGCGASHQTGWTALVANVLERVAFVRAGGAAAADGAG